VLIACAVGAIFGVGVKVVVVPEWATYRVRPFDFPSSVALAGWQASPAPGPIGPKRVRGRLLGAGAYDYAVGGKAVRVEMRYFAEGEGDGVRYFQEQMESDRPLEIRSLQGIGFHGLQFLAGRVYLSTCIDPQGAAVVTPEQFWHNRELQDRQWRRWVDWLLGLAPLYDQRCLWVLMSVPTEEGSTDQSKAFLEQAWRDWHGYWRSHFPAG
jgi:cyanosortase A-associated protein